MRPFLWVLFLILVLALAAPSARAESAQARACVGISPLKDKVRPVLVRALVPPEGPAFDEIRISISEAASSGARVVQSTKKWKLRKKKAAIHLLTKEATHGPVEVRIDFRYAVVPADGRVDLQLLADGRAVANFPAQRLHQFPRRELDSLLVVPPLLTAGEQIKMRPLDPCLTPPDGQWILGQERATPDPEHPGLVAVRLDAQSDSLTPLPLIFRNASGETLVQISNLFDSKEVNIAPPVEDEEPHLMACDQGPSQAPQACVCGWFPSAAMRSGLRVDGHPAPPPTAVSSRSLCFDLPPGPHRFAAQEGNLWPKTAPVELLKITLQARTPPTLLRGKRSSYQWTVTGTERPVELLVRNFTPGILFLEGGPVQKVRTSGGVPNTAQRKVKGLSQGVARVQATIPANATGGTAFRSLLRLHLVRGLAAVRSNFLAEVDRRQVQRRPEELPEVVAATEKELLAVLRYRELAPLREYVQAVFEDEIRPQARSLARRSASFAPSPLRTATALPLPVFLSSLFFTTVERSTTDGLINRILDLLETLAGTTEALVRDLEVASDPPNLMVHLYPKAFPTDVRSTGTTGTLDNLYFGRYQYQLLDPTKDKTIGSGQIDLIHQTEGILCLARKGWQKFISTEAGEACRKP